MSLQGGLFFIYKRFWEAKNVKRGGELMYLDVLLLDSKALLSRDVQSSIAPTSSEHYAITTVRSTKAATSSHDHMVQPS
ncbi:BnaA10g09230D [Brassica napus]|uniref:Uncharacterized protein n=2 Tax=Brassica TaxID=3705 RepID=M4DMX1_BRACM|nr:unnamed protein product [Brassica napus]CDY17289.1 BnaA10g09230D [Brassica napus]